MGYANPIVQHGGEKFASDCVAAGVEAVILVDIPPEQLDNDGIGAALRKHNVASIPLVSLQCLTSLIHHIPVNDLFRCLFRFPLSY